MFMVYGHIQTATRCKTSTVANSIWEMILSWKLGWNIPKVIWPTSSDVPPVFVSVWFLIWWPWQYSQKASSTHRYFTVPQLGQCLETWYPGIQPIRIWSSDILSEYCLYSAVLPTLQFPQKPDTTSHLASNNASIIWNKYTVIHTQITVLLHIHVTDSISMFYKNQFFF